MNKILFLSLLNIISGTPPPPPMDHPPVPPMLFASVFNKEPVHLKPTQYRYATEWLNRGRSNGVDRRTLNRTPPPPCPAPPHFFATKWINTEKG